MVVRRVLLDTRIQNRAQQIDVEEQRPTCEDQAVRQDSVGDDGG